MAGKTVEVYSSDYVRCVQTAEPVATAFGVRMINDERLREFNAGEGTNLTLAERRERWSDAMARAWGSENIPGAESWVHLYERSADFLKSLPSQGPLPIVVTHGGNIHSMVAWWLRIPFEHFETMAFTSGLASITTLRSEPRGELTPFLPADGGRWLERLNDVGHLESGEH